MTTPKNLDSLADAGSQEASRRTVLKAAAYVAPAVATLAVAPAFAQTGSREVSDVRRGRNSRGGNNPTNAPVRNRGGRGRGRGSSGS
ncbi:MAG: hypothetical protein AAGK22_11420 [Acidobacteriota bacterium]